MNIDLSDQQFMSKVIELASRGKSSTHPNPRIGCVIVKEGEVVGRGWHRAAGEPHAEIEALRDAGEAARYSTVYVNMEPCCHQGRTPPCTDSLILAGVARVVASMSDPNPQVAGGGFQVLREAGVDVDIGLLESEARWLNRGFIKRMNTGQPWVKVKIGATLDGRTATGSGESKWITCEAARADVQTRRSYSSAILTGIGTVVADDPRLNVRLEDAVRQPLRVVVDSHLRLAPDARIVGDDGLLLVFAANDDAERRARLEEAGVEVMVAPDEDGRVDLGEVFRELALRECNELFVESGHKLSGKLLELGLVDELVLYYAASILGNSARGMFDIDGIEKLADSLQFEYHDIQQIGSDIRAIAVSGPSMEMLA